MDEWEFKEAVEAGAKGLFGSDMSELSKEAIAEMVLKAAMPVLERWCMDECISYGSESYDKGYYDGGEQ